MFLDDYGIAKIDNLRRTMHQPAKKGAVIRPAPGGGAPSCIQTRTAPIWDPRQEVYKISALGRYYESKDGLHWTPAGETKPRVDCMVYDPSDADPSRRFKAALPPRGFAVSPDGVNWKMLDVPGVPSSDEYNFSFDPKEHLFILAVKQGGPHGRAVYLSTSKDFEHWTKPELIFFADDLDQKLGRENIKARFADQTLHHPPSNDPNVHNVDVYNMGVFRYEGLYIGIPAMYHATGPVPNYPNTVGFHLLQLAFSRDLKTWNRLGDRKPFIGPSRVDSGAYDLTQILPPSYPILRPGEASFSGQDELWFYYTGIKYRGTFKYVGKYPHGEHLPLPGLDRDQGAVCLAVLRRDGFVSLDAGEQEGVVLTKAFPLTGSKVFVNADALGGELRVEVLDEAGKPVAVSEALKEDLARAQVRWRQGDVASAKGKLIALRFTLRNARFYSYWVED
ncbi:MAG: hypothetical protein JXQ73_20625 [Phycisphaerae bacterium]|nr:hypothetical protein [Phycisphaerae bacterium]